jgi:hypothetical protein
VDGFVPGNQNLFFSHFNYPYFATVVSTKATISYTPNTYSFNIDADANASAEVDGYAYSTLASFESILYFHIDEPTVARIEGTVTLTELITDMGFAAHPEASVLLQITDLALNVERFFMVMDSEASNGPFEFTQALDPGNYYFRMLVAGNLYSLGDGDALGRARAVVNGTFTVPEPASLAFLAVAMLLPLHRGRRVPA